MSIDFRKEALEETRLPQRFDTAVVVIPPRAWLALGTFASLTIAFLGWGVWGRVSYHITARGMLIREGEVYEVLANGSGQLRKVHASIGEMVEEGQVVAEIDQPELAKSLEALRDALKELERKAIELSSIDEQTFILKKTHLRDRAKNYRDALAKQRKQLRLLEEKRTAQQKLLERGLITKTVLLQTTDQLMAKQEELNDREVELKDLSSQELHLLHSLEQQRWHLEREINDKNRELQQQRKRFDINSRVVCQRSGRVVDIKRNAGDYIHTAEPLLALESADQTPQSLELVMYLPAENGKRVFPNMDVRVVPSFVKVEEDGYILAKVDDVLVYPASFQSVLRVTRNRELAESLLSDGPVYEARGDLVLDVNTSSGYRWSGRGTPGELRSGTLCSIQVTVKSVRPIELVLPALRRLLGDSTPFAS